MFNLTLKIAINAIGVPTEAKRVNMDIIGYTLDAFQHLC